MADGGATHTNEYNRTNKKKKKNARDRYCDGNFSVLINRRWLEQRLYSNHSIPSPASTRFGCSTIIIAIAACPLKQHLIRVHQNLIYLCLYPSPDTFPRIRWQVISLEDVFVRNLKVAAQHKHSAFTYFILMYVPLLQFPFACRRQRR